MSKPPEVQQLYTIGKYISWGIKIYKKSAIQGISKLYHIFFPLRLLNQLFFEIFLAEQGTKERGLRSSHYIPYFLAHCEM